MQPGSASRAATRGGHLDRTHPPSRIAMRSGRACVLGAFARVQSLRFEIHDDSGTRISLCFLAQLAADWWLTQSFDNVCVSAQKLGCKKLHLAVTTPSWRAAFSND